MFKIGIITASDTGARGEREDKAAGVIREMVAEIKGEVCEYAIVSDDLNLLKEKLIEFCGKNLDLVFTTGGTGFSPRDNTPEATRAVIRKIVPGLPEAMRLGGLRKTPRAMLSRATAGIRGQTLIVNLPGSPIAVQESLEIILPVLAHGLEKLAGSTEDCSREYPQKDQC